MVDCHLSSAEKTFIVHGIQGDMREDGRSCDDFRHIEVVTNVISNSSGSARLRLASTDVLVGVKAEVSTPAADHPDRGSIHFFTDCSANASPQFEGKGGDDLAIDISNCLSRAYNSNCVDLKSLCIDPGGHCWDLHVDIVVLEFGGDILDAVSVAVKAALYNTYIPVVKVISDGGVTELEISDDPTDTFRLDVSPVPVIVTLSKISHRHIVDATPKEEACAIARLTMAITEKGVVTFSKTQGSGSLQGDSLIDMMQTGKKVGQELNTKLMTVLQNEEKKAQKRTDKLTTFLI